MKLTLTLTLVTVLALSTFGCKKKEAAGPDCAKAVTHSMDLSKADMQKMGVDAAMMQKMTDLGVRRCTEDKWSAAAVTCMIDAKAMTDAQACYDKLTPEQQEKMKKAASELAPPQAGSAAAGSADATGSAGSAGSAAAGSADATSSAGSAATGSAAATK